MRSLVTVGLHIACWVLKPNKEKIFQYYPNHELALNPETLTP